MKWKARPGAIIIIKDWFQKKGLKQVTDTSEIERIVADVIKAHPEQHAEYKSGKDKLFGFFVGQMMQKTKGKGNPTLIQELLKKHLS